MLHASPAKNRPPDLRGPIDARDVSGHPCAGSRAGRPPAFALRRSGRAAPAPDPI